MKTILIIFILALSFPASAGTVQNDLLFLKKLADQSEVCVTRLKETQSLFTLLSARCMNMATQISSVESDIRNGEFKNRLESSKGNNRIKYMKYSDKLTNNLFYIANFLKGN